MINIRIYKELYDKSKIYTGSFKIDESYYINSFFINKIGRLKFTEQVLKDLGLWIKIYTQ